MKDRIQEALGGDTPQQIANILELPFMFAKAVLKELVNIIPNLVGKIGTSVLKIATLGAVEVEAPTVKLLNTEEDTMKLKKVLNDIMGAKVYLTIGAREHTDGNAFYSKQYKFREVLFKETPAKFRTANEVKVGKVYKE